MGTRAVSNMHSAKDIYLAYVYQSMQALSLLLSAQADDILVRLEAEDDLTLIKPDSLTLGQVKHTKTPISLKSADLWRTLRIWCEYIQIHGTSNNYFILLTTSAIQKTNILTCLLQKDKDQSVLSKLQLELNKEANSVLVARKAASQGANLPYQDRNLGCEAFLKLKQQQQKKLLERITFFENLPNIHYIEQNICDKLYLVPSNVRAKTANKILEWWHHTVLESFKNAKNCNLSKTEVLNKINEIAFHLRENILTDDMAHLSIPDNIPLPQNIQKQLEVIDAIASRGKRSAKMYWLAREQRSRWVNDNPGNTQTVEQYDNRLVSEWENTFHTTCSSGFSCEDNKKSAGRDVLDWTHQNAHNQVKPIREKWDNPDYVRGSFQILSDHLRVGWHPDFELLLGAGDDS